MVGAAHVLRSAPTVMKIVIATVTLAALFGIATSLVAAATASPGARWLVQDTASDYDPSGYATTANVSDSAGIQSGDIPIVPRAARVRVRAPRGPVELRMNTECNPVNEFARPFVRPLCDEALFEQG